MTLPPTRYCVATGRFLIAVFVTVLALYLPLQSIIELLSTGTIDPEAVGRGSPRYPVWLLYLVAWSSALIVLPFFGPILWHYLTGFELSLSDKAITVRDVTITFDELDGFERVGFHNRLRIHSCSGSQITIPAVLGKPASDEIARRLQNAAA